MIERIDELEKALGKSEGRAVVLVHPRFHLSSSYGREDPRRTAAGRRYLAVQRAVVRKSRLPVIVFEEEQHALATQKAFGTKVFVVPTCEQRPEPIEGWRVLDLLKEKGLKHGLFGGQKLSCSQTKPPFKARDVMETLQLEEARLVLERKKGGVYGCVGGAMRQFMRRGLQVSLMKNVVYPAKLK